MQQVKLTTEQAEGLQHFITVHMDNCLETLDLEDCSFVTEDGQIFETYAPYCGCQTCNTREQLMATFDYLRKLNIADIFVSDES
jgi:hypothetical protein